ncbi:MAG: NUDIX hydrolase [Deltaproteobacteria bacterium]|nr:NUDIX hydrolase [Candidatus Tharpella sp.]
MRETFFCPNCNYQLTRYRNPVPTVDILISYEGGIVLIERLNPPPGWALPGGFVDYGESLETAAVREAREETGLEVELISQFHTYSDPQRDPRQHTISTVFTAVGKGKLQAGDDAGKAVVYFQDNLPVKIAFDHRRIINDYFLSF